MIYRLAAGGLAALLLGYAGNRAIWSLCGGRGTVWLVPLWEETVKTAIGGAAGSVLWVHVLFGLGEAAVEMRTGLAASLAAAVSHTVFGFVTQAVGRACACLPAGWLVAVAAHLGWNLSIVKHARARGGR